jgi:ABC-type multidrug transport system ATPase subunit
MNVSELEEGVIKNSGIHPDTGGCKLFHKRQKALIEPIRQFSWNKVGLSFEVKVKEETMKKQILENLSGSILAGEVVGLMGGSGAGKTSLLNTLAGRIGPGILTGKF